MSTSCANTANVLERAAFGSNPDAWPLPPADTAHELWLRAVIAGGQGRYASALADLDRLRRSGGSDARASLASSTRASFFRQLGWHHVARGWDGRAAALAHTDEAWADAMIGLAADALGWAQQGFGRDTRPVGALPADQFLLDQRDPPSARVQARGGGLAARSGADHDYIEVRTHSGCPFSVMAVRAAQVGVSSTRRARAPRIERRPAAGRVDKRRRLGGPIRRGAQRARAPRRRRRRRSARGCRRKPVRRPSRQA